MTESRKIDLSVEVPGTPEAVWDAIATGPGISSWFIPMTIEPRAGGDVVFDWGEGFGQQKGRVDAWEPPHRFVYSSEGDDSLAFEWLVEAGDGGTCVVRLVNSGFGAGDDWDEQYDGMSDGWPVFLENLRLLLLHFDGRPAARTYVPTVMAPGPGQAAWEALCSGLGVRPDLRVGERFSTSGAPLLAGEVATVVVADRVRAYHLVLDAPAPGTAFVTTEGDGDQVALSIYQYLHADAPDEIGPWLRSRYPAPAPTTTGS